MPFSKNIMNKKLHWGPNSGLSHQTASSTAHAHPSIPVRSTFLHGGQTPLKGKSACTTLLATARDSAATMIFLTLPY